jgi:hypothetical protein
MTTALHICPDLALERPDDEVLRIEPIGDRWALRTIRYRRRDDQRPERRRYYSSAVFINFCPFCGKALTASRTESLRWVSDRLQLLASSGQGLSSRLDREHELLSLRQDIEFLLEQLGLKRLAERIRESARVGEVSSSAAEVLKEIAREK